jgi:hypothetical protein
LGKRAAIDHMIWSIALPGCGQLLNGKIVKGLALLILEFLINHQSSLNKVIIASFQGNLEQAIQLTNYQWLMYYPCFYMFSIYDAYRDAANPSQPYSALPFAFAAFLATVGVIFSDKLKVYGVWIGPVWLPMFFCFVGIGIGVLIRTVLLKNMRSSVSIR